MLTVKVTYVLEITPAEFRLISSALTGTMKPEQVEDAEALQGRLFHSRNCQVKQQLENILKMDSGTSVKK